jgi:hypothetical protein
MDWKTWLKGLLAAFIGAAANGVILSVTDPATFNFQAGIVHLGSVCLTSGVVSVALYLKQSPLPKE